MSDRRARVIAPYATVKMLDPISGKHAVRGFYRDAVLPPEADPEGVATLVRREYAEWVDEPVSEPVDEPARPIEALEVPVGTEFHGDPNDVPPFEAVVVERPPVRAPKDDWVAYAVSQRAEGASEEDARAEAEGKKKEDLIAEYYSKPADESTE